jgi:hypothetical protein
VTAPIRVFVNGRAVDVPPGTPAVAALRAADPDLADAVTAGTARLTDARGIELGPDTRLAPGHILRALRIARRTPADADA